MPLRHWAQNRNIVLTKTSGDNYKANGRCEAELGVVKRSIRTVLSAGGFSLTWWPLIAKHVRERRLRAQLRSFGYSVGDLLRFGTKMPCGHHRYDQWTDACSILTTTNYLCRQLRLVGTFFY